MRFRDAATSAIASAADFLHEARELRRIALALALGALSAFAFAPFNLIPLLLLAYAGLVILLDGAAASARPLRDAAFTGWAFGFAQFFVGLHWLGYAFVIDAQAHAWQLPFVALLVPGGLAFFPAMAGLLYAGIPRAGAARIFLFAFLFALAEFLRGQVLTGFPWNLAGYAWGASWPILQSTAVIGAYGLSLLTILFGASLALLAPRQARGRASLLPAAMTILFLAIWAAGITRLASADDASVPGVYLRVVQPNVPQAEKYRPQFYERNWRRLIELSLIGKATGTKPTHIIWPESAPPFPLGRAPGALADIAVLTEDETVLMTGAVRAVHDAAPVQRYANSFFVFARRGKIVASYDKFHLVPFGEYMPFQRAMDSIGLTKLTGGPGGFAAGAGPRTLDIPHAPPAGPLICYEVIFPRAVTETPRPGWLINVTDDAWFGPGPGPKQHLLTARVRAIEEGLPIVRAANTGVSAIIDAYGRMRGHLDLGAEGALDGRLPIALEETFFVRFGAGTTFVLFVFVAAGGLLPLRRGRA